MECCQLTQEVFQILIVSHPQHAVETSPGCDYHVNVSRPITHDGRLSIMDSGSLFAQQRDPHWCQHQDTEFWMVEFCIPPCGFRDTLTLSLRTVVVCSPTLPS